MATDARARPTAFDYTGLTDAEAKALEGHARAIDATQDRVRRVTAEGVLALGRHLKAAQERLANCKNGVFVKWAKQRCGISTGTAYNAISAFNTFQNLESISQFDASSLYLLSADCCPEKATTKALRLADKGERITHKRAQELIDEFTMDEEPYSPDSADLPDGCCCVTSLDELAGEQFGTIYADPPWQYGNQSTRAATDKHYRTLTVDELCAMSVGDLAADDAHLHLWTTNGFLPDAFRVIAAWGFDYKSCFVWVKPQMGIGNYWRVSHEFLLLGVRGDATRFNMRDKMSWLQADRTKHSAKPEVVSQIIEQVSPGPFLELFGRRPAKGWTVFGNQIEARLFA